MVYLYKLEHIILHNVVSSKYQLIVNMILSHISISETEVNLLNKSSESMEISTILKNIETFVGILLSILTGVGIILSYRYIKSFKEKTSTATFTFWAHMKLRISRIKKILEDNHDLINNMYNVNSRISWECVSVEKSDIEELKNLVNEAIQYLEEAVDQVPAYKGWCKDIARFQAFLLDIKQYDICDSKNKFISDKTQSVTIREKYIEDICKVMGRIILKIEERQEIIEQKLYP